MPGLIREVDPFIGVDGAGNTLCGPYLPFALARPGPDTIPPQSTNGYRSKLPLLRFSHLHVSGTGGGGRYGNIGVTPFRGPPRLFSAAYDKGDERSSPGYYRVRLAPDGIEAELTCTPRCGVHRYRFPAGPANIQLEADACLRRDFRANVECLGAWIEWVGPRAVVGRGDFRGGWGHSYPYSVFFYAEFDREPGRRLAWGAGGPIAGPAAQGLPAAAVAHFADGGEVGLRVGVSFVSVANARAAVERECGARAFDDLRAEAEAIWERYLGRIRVEGGSRDERRIFYTFLTRLVCMPGDLGVDDENHLWRSGVRQYNDFYCLWDSVRNANSLITLIDPEREVSFLNALLDIAEHTGWLADAWIAGHSAQAQGGSSADILFCEARLKGLKGVDYRRALDFMLKNSRVEPAEPWNHGRYLKDYRDRGWTTDAVPHCVSRHLEYSYQDWCAARLAAELGRDADAAEAMRGARKVWNLWRDDLKAFAPRRADGRWVEPFDPATCRSDSWNDPYCYEGPSVGWSFNVQHDFAGLVRRHGGPSAFSRAVDRFLARHSPCKEVFMHIPWLYHYAGAPARAAAAVWRILHSEYSTRRDGLPDNEDMGCHSAFYICGALGLYPIMGQDLSLLSAPFFRRAEISLGENGPRLIVEADGGTEGRARFLRRVELNGQSLNRAWLRHGEISGGGVLRMELADRPTAFGRGRPPPSPMA